MIHFRARLLALSLLGMGLALPAAHAQIPGGQGVSQVGSVTANDCVAWVGNNQIKDSGSACGGGGGSGTVTSFSVVTAHGVSATVANPTTTPAATFTLGAITPSSAAIGAGSAITSSGPGGALVSTAYTAIGTSGATVPLLSTANTWTLVQTLTAAPVFTDQSGSRTALGLGTIATQNANNVAITGGAISGATITGGSLVLAGATSGTTTLQAAAIAGTTTITFPGGTTDFSATGGASQVVKQTSAGGAFTVATVNFTDLAGTNSIAQLGGSGASHGALIDVAGTATWKVVPNCTDTGGNHLNYTQSTDAFSCGTSGGGSGSPGGSDTQVQYNNSGSFGGASGITTTGTELSITPAVNGVALTIANQTHTSLTKSLSVTQTQNNTGINAGVIFANLIPGASVPDATSNIFRVQYNTSDRAFIDTVGRLTLTNGSNTLVLVANNTGSALIRPSSTSLDILNSGASGFVAVNAHDFSVGNTGAYAGSSTSQANGSPDVYQSRAAAGVWSIDSAAIGDGKGSIRRSYAIASLPASPKEGDMAIATDALNAGACIFQTAPTAGGTTHCPVIYISGAWVGG